MKIRNFRENSAKFLQMLQNLKIFANFQNFQLDTLVDFEKCCKTCIFLQRSASIQPKTSNILLKNCQKLGNFSESSVSAGARAGSSGSRGNRAPSRSRRRRRRRCRPVGEESCALLSGFFSSGGLVRQGYFGPGIPPDRENRYIQKIYFATLLPFSVKP